MQVPEEVRAAARAAYRTHVPGRTLLVQLGNGDAAEGTPRCLRFSDGDLTVDVDVVPGEDDLVHLTVRLSPAVQAEVEVQHPDPSLTLVARGPSPLKLAAVPGGLTRLVVTALDGSPRRWHTAWTRL